MHPRFPLFAQFNLRSDLRLDNLNVITTPLPSYTIISVTLIVLLQYNLRNYQSTGYVFCATNLARWISLQWRSLCRSRQTWIDKCASIAEITALQIWPSPKGKKSIPSKDEVGHWYTAQLIHYGLPPSQGKARAKVRLLEGLNASKLTVPPEIKKLEDSLQKEYQAAERKAKAAYKKTNTLSYHRRIQ